MTPDSSTALVQLESITLPTAEVPPTLKEWWRRQRQEPNWAVTNTTNRALKRMLVFGNATQRRSEARHSHYKLLMRQMKRKWQIAARSNPVQVYPYGGHHANAAHLGQVA